MIFLSVRKITIAESTLSAFYTSVLSGVAENPFTE